MSGRLTGFGSRCLPACLPACLPVCLWTWLVSVVSVVSVVGGMWAMGAALAGLGPGVGVGVGGGLPSLRGVRGGECGQGFGRRGVGGAASARGEAAGGEEGAGVRGGKQVVRVPHLVRLTTPPPRALGTHLLPKNTTNGEALELPIVKDGGLVEQETFVVTRTTHAYAFRGGRYQFSHKKVEVARPGRWFVEQRLEEQLGMPSYRPPAPPPEES